MRNKKFNIILLIFFFTTFILVSCKTAKTPTTQEELNSKGNNSTTSQSIDTKEQAKSEPPATKPAPKEVKKEVPKPAPKKVPVKKQTSDNSVLAGFSTTLLDSDKDRVDNIITASQKINGYVLNSGEVFSFNNVVGKRDVDTGYKNSKILVNGQRSEGVGGGICQLSSTIYNAAKKLGLEIIERHSHSGEVHYVQRGQDAAVSYGYKDLKFKNNKSYPIKFATSIKNGKVYVSIFKAK